MSRKVESPKVRGAIALLEKKGYTVEPPPQETEYRKTLRTGKKPAIWPPIVMTQEDLQHFRATHGITCPEGE